MKKFLLALALILVCGPLLADQAVQTDQNAGFLTPATSTFSILVGSSTDLVFALPAGIATSSVQLIELPDRTRGFRLNVAGCDVVMGDPRTISTGTNFIGIKILNGSYVDWTGLRPDQRTIRIRLMPNAAANGTGTIACWGE